MIPSNELYAPGLAVLKRYPLPNRTQTPTTNYNYEIQPPQVENLTQQPAIRIDYQLSSKLRLNGKYSGQRARPITTPGLIPGFTDVNTPYPYITNYAFTVNYTLSPTTFVEGDLRVHPQRADRRQRERRAHQRLVEPSQRAGRVSR